MNSYTQIKTGKLYSMLQECKMKFGDRWVAGIVYLRDGKMFCRTKADFSENFEKTKK